MTQLFNSPNTDPRTPDIIVVPNPGVIYTGSTKKQEEHGGFSHDNTNVIMLLSNPKFRAKTVTSPVETTQVAPTILKALGLDVNSCNLFTSKERICFPASTSIPIASSA